MFDTLIKAGYRWSDFDDMTEEQLFDLVDTKSRKKEAMQNVNNSKENNNVPLDNSLENMLQNLGLL